MTAARLQTATKLQRAAEIQKPTGSPHYWNQGCRELSDRDPVLSQLIKQGRDSRLTPRGDPFQALARAIVGQQISTKAAQSVWNRFTAKAVEVTPDRVSRMRILTLRNCGLSERKAEYLRDLARHFQTGAIEPERWENLDDEAIIEELVAVRGIGRWTAEMFLIFNLERPNVFPVDDIGLLNALGLAYNHGARVSREQARELSLAWQPWRTVATWYLWRSLEPVLLES